ncbi:MAG: hypothetical protein B6245_14665 [Desulfobacteraceae bacterium 4572_88]|nr:MAG: hypothetical protein B6245_14665 [Desulfobacteraceae bacterium 4572_88]
MGWYCGNSGNTPHPVARKQPNEWGLYDMHGNVWEWCQDWYQRDYSLDDATDPGGPDNGSRRVGRGGSWFNDARICRSAYRAGLQPGCRGNDLGFRLVREAP